MSMTQQDSLFQEMRETLSAACAQVTAESSPFRAWHMQAHNVLAKICQAEATAALSGILNEVREA